MILGIDIGTHWARAAYLDASGQPRVLTLPDNSTALPAVARQSLMGLEVGREAAQALAGNAEVTLRGCTRLLGRPADLPQRVLDRLPYRCALRGVRRFATCSMPRCARLRSMDNWRKRWWMLPQVTLGQRVDGVVLTVPAAADDRYRIQARAAVEAQGIRVRRLINQPTAALLAAPLPNTAEYRGGGLLWRWLNRGDVGAPTRGQGGDFGDGG